MHTSREMPLSSSVQIPNSTANNLRRIEEKIDMIMNSQKLQMLSTQRKTNKRNKKSLEPSGIMAASVSLGSAQAIQQRIRNLTFNTAEEQSITKRKKSQKLQNQIGPLNAWRPNERYNPSLGSTKVEQVIVDYPFNGPVQFPLSRGRTAGFDNES